MCTYIYITWFHGDTSCEFFRYSAYFLRIVFPVISNCVATVDQHEKKRITTWTHTHTHLFETTSFLAAHCQLSTTTVCTVCFLKSERDFLSYIYSRLCQLRVAFFFFCPSRCKNTLYYIVRVLTLFLLFMTTDMGLESNTDLQKYWASVNQWL